MIAAKSVLRSATCLSAFALLGTAAYAQEAPAQEGASTNAATDNEDASIVVTGSRIARPEADSPNPVISIDSATLQKSGQVNLTDLLVQNPALIGSSTSADAGGSTALFGGVGINLLNLRNLGTDRTLVLVNGRRHIAGISGSAAVDINTIPNALIDRIDVLTGGVSAVYGADGVSGVVNFILKRDFEGIDVRGQSGISSRGDAGNYYGSVTLGKNFADDRGNVALSYEYNRENRVLSNQRKTGISAQACGIVRNPADFPDDPNVFDRILTCDLRYADSSTNGAVDTNIDFTPDFQGNGQPYDLGIFLPSSGGLVQGGSSTPTAGYQGDLQPDTEKHNINLLASFEFSSALRFFVEGKYTKSKNFSVAQPSFDFFTTIQADNPFIPTAIRNQIDFGPNGLAQFGLPAGVLVSRDNFDLGIRGESAKRETLRGVIGFDGEISDHARYELSYVYGETKTRFFSTNYRLADRYFAALDAVDQGQYLTGTPNGVIVCRSNLDPSAPDNDPNAFLIGAATSPLTFTPGLNSGCQPLNILGEGVASQAALDFINVDLDNRSKVSQHVVNGAISGDFGEFFKLPGGPVGFAIGAEYRKESSDFVPDTYLQQGALADIAPTQPEKGSFDVKEAFAELNVPLLRDMPLAHLLQFGAAIRFSDYSTVGKTTTWKVDGTYAPIRDVTFRGTYSEAVRAPNITELFAPQNGTFSFIDDPCDPTNIGEGSSFRQANCNAVLTALGINLATFSPTTDPQATVSLPGRSGGNPLLGEETAKTWTAGIVLKPRFIPGLVATFDWYDIKLRNAINTATAQDLVDLCVDQPTLDNVFCQDIVRDPTTGYVSDYLVGPANVAEFKTSGADFTVNYGFNAGKAGSFNLRLAGGYLENLSFVSTPGADVDVDTEESFAPKWSGTFDLTWTKDNFYLNYGVNYFSKTRRYTTEQLRANPDLADPKYFFYRAKLEHDIQIGVSTSDDRFTFYGGINNIFDRTPDVASLNYPSSFKGRFLYVGAKFNFDRLPFGK